MPAKVRAMSTAGGAWRVAGEVILTQPKLVLSVFILYSLFYTPYYLTWLKLGPIATLNDDLNGYGRWIIELAQGILCLPLTNAACRRVLLSEYADHPMWRSAVWRNRAFWVIAAVIFIVKVITVEMTSTFGTGLLHRVIQSDTVVVLVQWLFWFAGLALGLTLWLLVPAAAVNATKPRIRSTIQGLNGQFWRLWFTWLLASLPLWLPYYVFSFVTDRNANPSLMITVIYSLWVQLIGFVLVIVGATVMSIFYEATDRRR